MKIIYDPSEDYNDVPHTYYELEKYNDNSQDEIFFYGYHCSVDNVMKEKYSHYKRKIYYNWESPCSFWSSNNAISSQLYFDEVYTLCPYTADYINKNHGNITKQIPIPYTINTNKFTHHIKDFNNIEFDVIYQGGIHNQNHIDMIDSMKKYTYVLCCLGDHPMVTHKAVTTDKKMELIGKSKVSICSNLLYLTQNQVNNVKSNYDDWEENAALSYINNFIAPQFKSRMIEAAFCKTLNLVQSDAWNVADLWFVPGEDFIYYTDKRDLEMKLEDIIKNFERYIPIINSAYQKAIIYGIDNQIKKIINKEKMYYE